MTSLKPYLIRSLYEWITDNQLTPYLLVDADHDKAVLPQNLIKDGKIVLNIKPTAIQELLIDSKHIQFNARFSGKPMQIVVPIGAVLAIYAKENGEGMFFNQKTPSNPPPPLKSTKQPLLKKESKRPKLRVVK